MPLVIVENRVISRQSVDFTPWCGQERRGALQKLLPSHSDQLGDDFTKIIQPITKQMLGKFIQVVLSRLQKQQ